MIKKIVNKLIGAILMEWGIIDQRQLDKALEIYNERKGQSLIGEILLELKFVNEEDVIKAFKVQYAIPYISIKSYDVNREIIGLVPASLARKYKLILLDKVGGRLITIAMANPLDNQAINAVKDASACNDVLVYIATASEIKEAIDKYYSKPD